MASFLRNIFSSVLKYKEQRTNDALEAYPERLHVSALPERRFLKTSRVLVILALLSIALNFALGFVYMKMASSVHAIIKSPDGQITRLYQLDPYQKEIKPVDQARAYIPFWQLITESLIMEYLNLRFSVIPNMEEMRHRWSANEKLALYGLEIFGSTSAEREITLSNLQKGRIQDIFVYSIKPVSGNLYVVIYDLFSLPRPTNALSPCPCLEKNQECLQCLRQNALQVLRIKAFVRASYDAKITTRNNLLKNPYRFNVYEFITYPQAIREGDLWTDVDLIKD